MNETRLTLTSDQLQFMYRNLSLTQYRSFYSFTFCPYANLYKCILDKRHMSIIVE